MGRQQQLFINRAKELNKKLAHHGMNWFVIDTRKVTDGSITTFTFNNLNSFSVKHFKYWDRRDDSYELEYFMRWMDFVLSQMEC